jgi:putative endonuclease
MRLAVPGAVLETPDRQTLGKLGEEMACTELERCGYAIIARRFRTRFGEIDIVSDDHGTIVFVEVRARKSTYRGTAAESVTASKQRRIAAMALDYLARTGQLEARCRFDVVAIDGIGTQGAELRVIKDAFQVDR